MRSIFLEYSSHPALISEEMSETERQILFKKYTNEVDRLNQIVVREIIPKIVSQIQQYVDYLRDASQQPYYMDKPKNESVKGQKQYRSVTQVLSGGKF
jgi:cytochrome c556